MTLIELTQMLLKDFPNADTGEICRTVNELEHKISNEVLIPAGLPFRQTALEPQKDSNTALLIGENYSVIYTSYLSAFFALCECDFVKANAFSELFNEKFSEFAAEIRRNNIPAKKTKLKGGMLS